MSSTHSSTYSSTYSVNSKIDALVEENMKLKAQLADRDDDLNDEIEQLRDVIVAQAIKITGLERSVDELAIDLARESNAHEAAKASRSPHTVYRGGSGVAPLPSPSP
ncbi:hypothetical protein [Paraburkholderia sp. BL10I2N1]|uniref:hypothetical protein n=1 Tax=Paraburkholderia sp. BL10I2N1 TaxID=1938796 RepID=UPI0010614C27|nr:hypothetical protein [Paraburkholderia sp. BL10I2N1]TDN70435.1 hypothetical protein B0G77_3909 [Paraburkholderia sp. BL10I2N1]